MDKFSFKSATRDFLEKLGKNGGLNEKDRRLKRRKSRTVLLEEELSNNQYYLDLTNYKLGEEKGDSNDESV